MFVVCVVGKYFENPHTRTSYFSLRVLALLWSGEWINPLDLLAPPHFVEW